MKIIFHRHIMKVIIINKKKYNGEKLNEQLIKVTTTKEFFEDITFLIKELKQISNYNKLEILNTRWYERKNVILKFKNYAGLDKKLAIFEDNDNKTYSITSSAYDFYANRNESTKGKLPNYYRFSNKIKLNADVYRYYTNRSLAKRLLILNINSSL